MLATACVVGIVLYLTLAGFVPVGGDPELMYQPIKRELARALSAGRLPFWSDRLGLGVPLAAESHVAAFYPPNWLFYRLWDVATAYRLTMWLHFLALALATFAYARGLGIGREGSLLAAMSFALCGFQAVHTAHEPFYHAMPYLPLCLLFAHRYATTGRLAWLAGLALAWGAQITLGHFQIQMLTGGLVLLTGGWWLLTATGGRLQPLRRVIGLLMGLCWGAAIAWVQLRLTWELSGVSGFMRPPQFLSNFFLPPAHWAQFALPEVFLGQPRGVGEVYWTRHGTSAGEACAYAGVVPLILAFVGMVAVPRSRGLAPWRLIVPLSLALATMPGWWRDGFFVLLQLPGLGWFRAPARYTLLTSLGLALLAGRGLDHLVVPRRFWGGLALAILVGAAAWGWSIHWSRRADFRTCFGGDTLPLRFAGSALAWGLGIAAIIAWRRNWLGAWAPLSVTLLELGMLFFVGPIEWGQPVRLTDASPVLRQLAALPATGLIGGRLFNLPVDVGQTVAYPYLGITPPPPNYMLEAATSPPGNNDAVERRWQRRFGVTYGVWGSKDSVLGTAIMARIADPALDRVIASFPSFRRTGLGPWKLVHVPNPFPPAWVARQVREAPSWSLLFISLSLNDAPDEAWFLPEDRPLPFLDPIAQVASVQSWDGRTAIVEHDGSCILILRRIHYPGWVYRVNDGPEQPVLKVNGGLQGVRLVGAETSRIVLRYQPTGLVRATLVSLAALTAAVLVLGVARLRGFDGSPWSRYVERPPTRTPATRDR